MDSDFDVNKIITKPDDMVLMISTMYDVCELQFTDDLPSLIVDLMAEMEFTALDMFRILSGRDDLCEYFQASDNMTGSPNTTIGKSDTTSNIPVYREQVYQDNTYMRTCTTTYTPLCASSDMYKDDRSTTRSFKEIDTTSTSIAQNSGDVIRCSTTERVLLQRDDPYRQYVSVVGREDVDIVTMMIVGKYFMSNADYVNLMRVSRKFKDITYRYSFNPIPIVNSASNPFRNMKAEYIYHTNDVIMTRYPKKVLLRPIIYRDYVKYSQKSDYVIKGHVVINKRDNPFMKQISAGEHTIHLPDAITIIADESFKDSALEHITMSRVQRIGERAFMNTRLRDVVIPESVTYIGTGCFEQCEQMTRVTINAQIEDISNRMFMRSGLRMVVVPEGIKRIGDYAFHGCKTLFRVVLPSTVEEIGKGIVGFTKVNRIAIPPHTRMIHKDIFEDTSSLVIIIDKAMASTFVVNYMYRHDVDFYDGIEGYKALTDTMIAAINDAYSVGEETHSLDEDEDIDGDDDERKDCVIV